MWKWIFHVSRFDLQFMWWRYASDNITFSHFLNCTFFIKNFPHLDLNNIKLKDLFGKISDQHKATKMFQELISIMKAKETESEKVNASGWVFYLINVFYLNLLPFTSWNWSIAPKVFGDAVVFSLFGNILYYYKLIK